MKSIILPSPITVNIAAPNQPENLITTSRLAAVFHVDIERRFVTANLHPIRVTVPLCGPRQFAKYSTFGEDKLLERLNSILTVTDILTLVANKQPYWLQEPPLTPAEEAIINNEQNGIAIQLGNKTYVLGAKETDQAAFTSTLTLYQTAENLLPTEEHKAGLRASNITIADHSGTMHTMTVTQFRRLMVDYGTLIHQAWAAAKQ